MMDLVVGVTLSMIERSCHCWTVHLQLAWEPFGLRTVSLSHDNGLEWIGWRQMTLWEDVAGAWKKMLWTVHSSLTWLFLWYGDSVYERIGLQ